MIPSFHVHTYHLGVLLNAYYDSVELCAEPKTLHFWELPDDADDAGTWTTLLIRVKSALALDFIKTILKLVLFTVFVKIKPMSFLFGASVYKRVKQVLINPANEVIGQERII